MSSTHRRIRSFLPLSMRKTFPISAWRALCSPSSTCSLHDSYAIWCQTQLPNSQSAIMSISTPNHPKHMTVALKVKLDDTTAFTAPWNIVQSRRPLRRGRRGSEGGAERCRLSSPTAGPPPVRQNTTWCTCAGTLVRQLHSTCLYADSNCH